MRFTAPACMALALTAGCLRFGYHAEPKVDSGFDLGAARPDGSMSDRTPAADGGSGRDAGMDAALRGGAGGSDTGIVPVGGSGGSAGKVAMDAGTREDAAAPDTGVPDAGKADSGATDSGAKDAGVAGSGGTDAGRVDSGTIGSGSSDPVDPSWTEDCPGMPNVLFCDDFEGSLSKWTYTVQTRGTTALTTNYKHLANYSLQATTSASTSSTQSKARRGVKAFGHRKSGDLWARFYYYLPNTVSLTDKFSAAVISEFEQPWLGFSILIFPDGVGIESLSVSRRTTAVTFPRDKWVCVEMHVQIDASSGMFEYFFNGNQVMSLLQLDTLPDQGYTSFEIGVHYANFNQGPVTTYTDDVMLGTSRIGCN